MACSIGCRPSRASAEISKTGPFHFRRLTKSFTRAARSASGTMSSLLSTSPRGLAERRQVDEVQQQSRALEVAQERVAEAGAFGRAFDQPGDVGDDEALFRC